MGQRPLLFFAVAARGKWICAGGLVFDRDGRVALVRQRSRSGELRWTLPKGRLDPGESLEAAALREVREESGLRARITGYAGVYEGKRNFVHYFVMTLVRVDGDHDGETVAVRFVSADRARQLVRGRRDRCVLERVQPSALRRSA